jgi:hypothetical protein
LAHLRLFPCPWFSVEDPDALFNEYRQRSIERAADGVHDTPWGTCELVLYDVDRNALAFYRHLMPTETGRSVARFAEPTTQPAVFATPLLWAHRLVVSLA